MSADEFVQIAKVLKSNGTAGDILLNFRDFDPSDIDLKEPVYIFFDGLPVPFFFTEFTERNSSRVLAHLMDIDCLKDAEEIVGQAVYAESSRFAEYQHGAGSGMPGVDAGEGLESFIGLKIADPSGQFLGTVSDFEDIPGNPCLYLARPDGEEVLIPIHEDFVVDVTDDCLVMRLPDGVL